MSDDRWTTVSGKPRRRSRVVIVLPAFNEESNMARLLDRISETLEEEDLHYLVIVVDDGSTDRTGEILESYRDRIPLRIERHKTNQGLGATIRDGLLVAASHASPQDIVITMDADDSHTPGLILRMIRMIREGHDVVIASRYRPGARIFGLSAARRLISYAASWLLRILFPTPGIRDFTCGYRAYRAATLQAALSFYGEQFVNAEGFQCMVDILLKLRRMQTVFGEVPLILRYDQKGGKSKMNVGRTAAHTLALVVRRRLGVWK